MVFPTEYPAVRLLSIPKTCSIPMAQTPPFPVTKSTQHPSVCTKEAVVAALAKWSAEEFEAEVFRWHLCAAPLRTYDVMDVTPQGIYQMNVNPIYINKISDTQVGPHRTRWYPART